MAYKGLLRARTLGAQQRECRSLGIGEVLMCGASELGGGFKANGGLQTCGGPRSLASRIQGLQRPSPLQPTPVETSGAFSPQLPRSGHRGH